VVGELGAVRRYSYWSDRRIRQIAADNDINLTPRWLLGIRTPTLSILPQVEASERPGTPRRNKIAVKIETAIGLLAVEDFETPPPVRFAKGVGSLSFACFSSLYAKKKALLIHTRTKSSSGCRVEICLFGSMENCADYLGLQTEAPGWSSSSSSAIEEFVARRGTRNDSQWDDEESMAVETLRTVYNEGMRSRYVFKHIRTAEWFAEIYHDVELDKGRWDLRPGSDLRAPLGSYWMIPSMRNECATGQTGQVTVFSQVSDLRTVTITASEAA